MNVNDEHITPRLTTAEEYCAAIAALDDSTRAIEIHLDASRKVLEASKKQLQSNPQIAPGRTEPHSQRKQILRLVDSLRGGVSDRHAETSADLQKYVAAILIATDDTLARHDHEFGRLDRDQSSSVETTSKGRDERAAKLIGALQHCVAETIRVRLDRIYQEALQRHPDGSLNGSRQAVEGKVDAVQEDLRLLHSEIDDVAQMLVMQQHGNELDIGNQKLRESEIKWTDSKAQRSSQQLKSMNEQLDTLIERAELLQSHRELQKRLASFLDTYQATTNSRQPSPVKTETGSSSRQTASVTALRQCLGVDGSNYNEKVRSERIDSMFIELVEHVNSSLSLQSGHFDQFQQQVTISHTTEKDLPANASLDELDGHISVMKTKMDRI